MRSDVRYAIRGLKRNPGFAIAAVLTLALGIGSVTSIFSVADAVLFRPLPFPNQDRLVIVWDQLTKLNLTTRNTRRVIGHVLASGMRPVVIGLVLGIAGAIASTRLIASVLFHVTATDPATFAIALAILAAVALMACLGPARRAIRIDPADALRAE